jgi:hypothetical protein
VNRRQARAARRLVILVRAYRSSSTNHLREAIVLRLPRRYFNAAWVDTHLIRPTERQRARRYWR